MKLAILLAVMLSMFGLSGWLLYDNVRLRDEISRKEKLSGSRGVKADGALREQLAEVSQQLAEANEKIARLKNELRFPIQINCKKNSGGFNVQLLNTFTDVVPITVTFTNATLKKSRTLTFELGPGFAKEVGHLEGWSAAAGDVVSVECPDYLPVSRTLQ